jgi:kynurenine formamidase
MEANMDTQTGGEQGGRQTVRTLDDVRAICRQYSNWGRWGPYDELGSLNFITGPKIAAAAQLVKRGQVFSLAIPLDDKGPQSGGTSRFNPIHTMLKDGADIAAGTFPRDFGGGADRELKAIDDLLFMPLQAATQWDALSHIVHDGKIWNGVDASWVTSKGALRNDIAKARSSLIGRGVLLDFPCWRGKDWLDHTEPIDGVQLDGCARDQGVAVESGDIVLVRTGRMARVRAEGGWNGYDSIHAGQPGLGPEAASWLYENEIAAVATDTLAVEATPSSIVEAMLPLHIVALVYMGLHLGEIFDLEELAADCARDGTYEFLFVGPPLPITGAVGSPVNPVAIK